MKHRLACAATALMLLFGQGLGTVFPAVSLISSAAELPAENREIEAAADETTTTTVYTALSNVTPTTTAEETTTTTTTTTITDKTTAPSSFTPSTTTVTTTTETTTTTVVTTTRPVCMNEIYHPDLVGKNKPNSWDNTWGWIDAATGVWHPGLTHYEIYINPKYGDSILYGQHLGSNWENIDLKADGDNGYFCYEYKHGAGHAPTPIKEKKDLPEGIKQILDKRITLHALVPRHGYRKDITETNLFSDIPNENCWYMMQVDNTHYRNEIYFQESNWIVRIFLPNGDSPKLSPETEKVKLNAQKGIEITSYSEEENPISTRIRTEDRNGKQVPIYKVEKSDHLISKNLYGPYADSQEIEPDSDNMLTCYLRNKSNGAVYKQTFPIEDPKITDVQLCFLQRNVEVITMTTTDVTDEEGNPVTTTTETTVSYEIKDNVIINDLDMNEPYPDMVNYSDTGMYFSGIKRTEQEPLLMFVKVENDLVDTLYLDSDSETDTELGLIKAKNFRANSDESEEIFNALKAAYGDELDKYYCIELEDGRYSNLTAKYKGGGYSEPKYLKNYLLKDLVGPTEDRYAELPANFYSPDYALIIDSVAPVVSGVAEWYGDKDDNRNIDFMIQDNAYNYSYEFQKRSAQPNVYETVLSGTDEILPTDNDTENNCSITLWEHDRHLLGDGTYTLLISPKDFAGNTGVSFRKTITLDCTEPTGSVKLISASSPIDNGEWKEYWFRDYDDLTLQINRSQEINMRSVRLEFNINNQSAGNVELYYPDPSDDTVYYKTDDPEDPENPIYTESDLSLSQLLGHTQWNDDISKIEQIEIKAFFSDYTHENVDIKSYIRMKFDNKAPTIEEGKVTVQNVTSPAAKVLRLLTFGLYSKEKVSFTVKATDGENGCGVAGVSMILLQQNTAQTEIAMTCEDEENKTWSCILDADTLGTDTILASGIHFITKDNIPNPNTLEYFVSNDTVDIDLNDSSTAARTLKLKEYDNAEMSREFGLTMEEKPPVFSNPILLQSAASASGTAWVSEKWYPAQNGSLTTSSYIELTLDDTHSGIYEVKLHLGRIDRGNGAERVIYTKPDDLQKCAHTLIFKDSGTSTIGNQVWSIKDRNSDNNSNNDIRAASEIPHKLRFRISMQDIINLDNTALNSDGLYSIVAEAEDLCGNTAAVKSFSFHVDNHNPNVNGITFSPQAADDRAPRGEDLTAPVETIQMGNRFGYFFKEETTVTVNYSDAAASSGIAKVEYYLQDYTVNGNNQSSWPADPDDAVWNDITDTAGNHTGTATFTVRRGFRGMVYVKVTDTVGNTSGIITPPDAFVVDDAEAHNAEQHIIFSELGDPAHRDNDGFKLFANQVEVSVTIVDTMSGIRELTVNRFSDLTNMPEETLRFDDYNDAYQVNAEINGWRIVSMDRNLITEITKTYLYDTDDNGITIIASMTDRANNTQPASQLESFSIDMTAPEVQVTFDNTNGRNRADGNFFNNARTATITVSDRNFGTLTNGGANIAFHQDNQNAYVYTAEVSYNTTGRHNIQIDGIDLAGHSGTPFAQDFIIDMENMSVTTNVKSFSNPATENNFNEVKEMTFTFKDDNFDPNLIHANVISRNPVVNGALPNQPYRSEWKNNTLTLTFEENLQFQVRLSGEDKAGNQHLVWIDAASGNIINGNKDSRAANSIESEVFEIDTIAPELKEPDAEKAFFYGKNKKADGKDEGIDSSITPTILYEDINSKQVKTKILRYFIEEDEDKSQRVTSKEQTETIEGNSYQLKWQDGETIPDGVYEIETTAYDLAGNSTKAVHTVFVQTVASHMVFAPREDLDDFDNIGKNYDQFGDLQLPITAILEKGEEIEIMIGGEVVPDTYIETVDHPVSRTSKVKPEEEELGTNSIKRTMILHMAYIQDKYNTDDIMVDYALAANIRCGEETETVKLATVSIDNVAPTGDYKAELKAVRNVYDAESLDIIIEGVADDVDLEACEFNDLVNGKTDKIPVKDISMKDHNISFTLGKGNHVLSVILCDHAGNTYPLDSFTVYIGTFLGKWGKLIFGGTGSVVVIGGLFAAFRVVKKRREASALL